MTNLQNNTQEITQDVIKRGRGRPKGAKNKPKTTLGDASEGATTDSPLSSYASGTVKRRGRPKGSKNKLKSLEGESSSPDKVAGEVRRRGRPKGAKNKATLTLEEHTVPRVSETPVTVQASIVAPEDRSETHPVMEAAKWLEKRMPVIEVQYYRTRASKQGITLTSAVSLGILGLFNVQDPEVRKQIKI
jgi:hypothetical protein